jgi:hypothetical protein
MFYPSLGGSAFNFPNNYALSTATAAENAARQAQTEVELFRHDIERLLLITEALWTFMKQQHGYTDDKLVQLIQDLEKRKATAYSSVAKDPPVICSVCGRPNTATRPVCMYCGNRLAANPFAR